MAFALTSCLTGTLTSASEENLTIFLSMVFHRERLKMHRRKLPTLVKLSCRVNRISGSVLIARRVQVMHATQYVRLKSAYADFDFYLP